MLRLRTRWAAALLCAALLSGALSRGEPSHAAVVALAMSGAEPATASLASREGPGHHFGFSQGRVLAR